ncbi:odorant receptor 131-2-like [Megalops cyprinoides]|uniref:odorant receptor 131-2-like n=1 Tax=Megalops cyprinoides TaxID=118141 RepID=UPI001865073F|nr:odorant receptor 131-2-like [Megalops cyprinoides]
MVQSNSQNWNSSTEELVVPSISLTEANVGLTALQLLVWFFLYVNGLMLFTFFSKQAFRGNTRYILFAHTLLSDSVFLLLTDLVVLLTYFFVMVPMGFCILLCIIMEIVTNTTPLTITAMCLERYVAICMPLRHAEISTTGRTIAAIVIISALCSINPFMDLFILVAAAPPSYLHQQTFCYYEVMLFLQWQSELRAVLNQVACVLIAVIIVFCYTKIMLAAKAASGENKESASKGRRTLLLHSLQLFLSMIDMWCPYIEAFVQENYPQVHLSVQYFNFLAFSIISRALGSLIYGLRDQKFFLALKHQDRCKLNPISAAT